MPDNDVSQMARDLATSEPLMVLGKLAAEGGQKVQDAYDTIKQHLSTLGTQAEQAVETGASAVKKAATTAGSAISATAGKVADAIVPKLGAEELPADQQPAKMTPTDFAARIKAKYPAYHDIPDDELVAKMVAKFPQYKDQISAQPTTAQIPQPFNAPRFKDQPQPGLLGATLGQAAEAGKGVVKGALHTAIDAGQLVAPALRQIPGVKNLVATPEQFQQANDATAYSNTAQRVGGAVETVGEMAVPVGRAVSAVGDMIPTAAKAAPKFAEVMGAARNVPVNVEPAGQAALRVQQLAERGATLPKAVNDFLKYVTNPEKPQMTYEVGRDFLTNLGKLSVSERLALNKPMQREVAIMTGNLAKSVAESAAQAGKGQLYAQAMTEYARAKRLETAYDLFLKGAQKALPAALVGGAAGAGYWLTSQIKNILGEKP